MLIFRFLIRIGSVAGGAVIEIMGYGFSQTNSYVQIGLDQNVPYYYYYYNDKNNTQITFNKITIKTRPLENGTYDVKVFDRPSTDPMKSLSDLYYTFSTAITPVLNSSSPSSVNESSIVTLNGNNFGNDTTKLVITIGTQQCEPLTANDTEITCQLNGLNLGVQNVLLNIIGLKDF